MIHEGWAGELVHLDLIHQALGSASIGEREPGTLRLSPYQPREYNLMMRSIARRHTAQKWLVRVNIMQSISGR
jgi:hypothetical protein